MLGEVWGRGEDVRLREDPRFRPTPWGRWVAAGLTLAGCGLVTVLVWGGNVPAPRTTEPDVVKIVPEADPLAEFAVLPVATEDELRIATLRGDWGSGLVVGDHPLAGELRLATADEVTVERSPDGMEPTPDHGDQPMVLSLKGKRTGE